MRVLNLNGWWLKATEGLLVGSLSLSICVAAYLQTLKDPDTMVAVHDDEFAQRAGKGTLLICEFQCQTNFRICWRRPLSIVEVDDARRGPIVLGDDVLKPLWLNCHRGKLVRFTDLHVGVHVWVCMCTR